MKWQTYTQVTPSFDTSVQLRRSLSKNIISLYATRDARLKAEKCFVFFAG